MKSINKLVFISFIICILFAISSVNAGIFEFVEDTGEVDDALSYDVDDEDLTSEDDEDYEIKKFKIKSLESESVLEDLAELQDEIDEEVSDDFETEYWLSELIDYLFFEDEDGDYIVVNDSEADKLPSSSKYSSCTIECKVIDSHLGEWGNYYLVKDINVIKKVKKEKKSTKSSSSSSKSSSGSSDSVSTREIDGRTYYVYDDSGSSGKSSSSSSYDSQSYHYVGNSATGKFHASSCHDVDKMNEGNMVNFYSRDDAINNGYKPCGHCRP